MSREIRYVGEDRMVRFPPPPRRGRDRSFSPPRRGRDRCYSPRSDRYALQHRTRERDYSPQRLHERDYLLPRAQEHCYSPTRAQERHYSPSRAQERHYSPSRARERHYSPRRKLERHCSPPMARERHNSSPRAGDRHYFSPRAQQCYYSPSRAREHHYLPPSSAQDQKHSPLHRMPSCNYLSPMRSRNHEFMPSGNVNEAEGRGEEYFHELERSRRMERVDVRQEIGELPRVGSSSYGGGERWYGKSQSLRLSENDSRNGDLYVGSTDSRRKYDIRDGLARGDSASVKYQFNNLNDPRKSDASNDPIDHGFNGAGVTSELGNEGRTYSGLVDSRAITLEVDRRRLCSSYELPPLSIGDLSRSSGFGDANGCASESHNLSMKLQKVEQNPFQGTLHLDKSTTERQGLRDLYMENDTSNSLRQSKYDSNYEASSHLNAFTNRSSTTVRNVISSSFGEDIHIPSDGIITSIGRLSEPIEYGQSSGSRSPKGQVNDIGTYPHSFFAQTKERHGSHMYSDIHGTKTASTRPSEFYKKNVGVREEHSHLDVSGEGFMDPITYDDFSHPENFTESKLWDYIPSSQGQSMIQSTLGYSGASGVVEKREQEMNILEYESTYKLHDYEMDEHLRSDVLYRDHIPHLDETNDSLEQRLIGRNQILPKPSTGMLKRKHGTFRKLSIRGGLGITPSSDGRSDSRILDQGDSAEICLDRDKDFVTISEKSKVNHSKYGKNIRTHNTSTQHGPRRNLSTTMASRLSKTSKYGTRDIKNRLGPHPQVKKYSSSLKHRLGPPPKKSRSTLPWMKNLTSHKVSHFPQGLK